MIGPVRYIIRKIAYWRKHARRKGEGAIPLSKVKSATVLVDMSRADAALTAKVVEKYFSDKKIKVNVICPEKKDISYAGYFKKHIRGDKKNPRKEDLYISLNPDDADYAVWYDAVCSPARSKIGCSSKDKNVFDIYIDIPQDRKYNQVELFSAMANCLERLV